MLAVSAALAAQPAGTGEKLVNENDCSSCHAPDRVLVGPSYAAIAKRYAGQPSAVTNLSTRIREGGSGNWGDVAMTPHPDLTDAQATADAGLDPVGEKRSSGDGQRLPRRFTRTNSRTVRTVNWISPCTRRARLRRSPRTSSRAMRCTTRTATGAMARTRPAASWRRICEGRSIPE